MRTMTSIFGALLLLLSSAVTTHAQVVIKQPDLARGSQLIFYYDAREGFTTFVNIQNGGGEPLRIQLDVWGPTFTSRGDPDVRSRRRRRTRGRYRIL